MSSQERPVFNDRYEIHRRIGRGGMADVFLARDRLLDRPVAVKVLFPEYAADPSFVERFRREAQAAANLNHPNVVGVYDWGRVGSTYFIVMEYVEGRTLSDILRGDGPLSPPRAADVAGDVAAALAFAHKNGVVHRDIKPGNILVSSSGAVKVADFGIARALNSANDQDLTQAGSVMGTATYFSPEQAQGANPDPRSDLYSLGIVMYEMVASRPPFTGENPVAVAYKQVHEQPPPLSSVRPDVPPAYEAIVNKLLSKRPEQRYPGADDLRADLRRYREGQPVAALAAVTALDATMANPTAGRTPMRASGGAVVAGGAPTRAMAAQDATRVQAAPPTATMAGPPGQYGYEEPPRRSGFLWLGVLVILALLAAAGWFLYQALSEDTTQPIETITLVDVRNSQLDVAKRTLEALGLVVAEEAVLNEEVERGVVWDQRPPPGTQVDAGSTVTLVFNPGKDTVTVPNLKGQSRANAEAVLAGLGLTASIVELESDLPEDTVIDQNPAAGEVDAGSTVTLTISIGQGQVAVPNVAGLDRVSGAAQLARAGFEVATVSEPSDTVAADNVIRTDPPAGTLADNGSRVTMVVSSGQALVPVPKVEGLVESAARDTLQAAGFLQSVRYVDVPFGSEQNGVVITQSPLPGTEAARGSTVTLTVGRQVAPPTTEATTTTTTTTTLPPDTTPDPTTP
jgi:eukaryotic-like serine/threonine-protein kinase